MAEHEAADGLRGLQQDLIALDESRLRNVARLWSDLEARIEEFRNLLDKPPKNESSRKKILSGMFSTWPCKVKCLCEVVIGIAETYRGDTIPG